MIRLYKPNKYNTGSALTISPVNRNFMKEGRRVTLPDASGGVFVQLTKQASWDEAKNQGYFKDSFDDKTKNITLMLNENEVAEILSCIREKRAIKHVLIDYTDKETIKKTSYDANFYHKTPNSQKSLKFYPKRKDCELGEFTLQLLDIGDKNYVAITLSASEVRLLEEALTAVLRAHFDSQIQSSLASSVKNSNTNRQSGTDNRQSDNRNNNTRPSSQRTRRDTVPSPERDEEASNLPTYDDDEFDTGSDSEDDDVPF